MNWSVATTSICKLIMWMIFNNTGKSGIISKLSDKTRQSELMYQSKKRRFIIVMNNCIYSNATRYHYVNIYSPSDKLIRADQIIMCMYLHSKNYIYIYTFIYDKLTWICSLRIYSALHILSSLTKRVLVKQLLSGSLCISYEFLFVFFCAFVFACIVKTVVDRTIKRYNRVCFCILQHN